MDPLTQGTLGAALPQATAGRARMGLATLAGFAGGMAPDLDVLIRSSEDPLLFLEYHRQFTHSLVFIPVGAAVVAALLWAGWGGRRGWAPRQIYGFCLLGYATHALLDGCTTYGTQLLWPFSDQRFAWNTVSIIDPLLSLPLLTCVAVARFSGRAVFARIGLAWVLAYLTLGLLARDRAQEEGLRLALARGHAPERVDAKPSFANLLVWKLIYRDGDYYYVDALRLGAAPCIYRGERVAALDLGRDFPGLDAHSQQARDVERFRWFSMGYLAADPAHPQRIMDLRYSLLPNEIRPLWSIEVDTQAGGRRHVAYRTHRSGREGALRRLGLMLRGEPLPAEGTPTGPGGGRQAAACQLASAASSAAPVSTL
ncbi:MAG: metal-dependent hydrolase [Halieaceae bacterium]|jgi:inner membrane protein|nr:metal-dependent hydrolase [Halieaceae bacterium]